MGRGKIEIKRIENSNNRQVTYSKRRKGILKKAREITVLCDAKVSLIIIASSGKMEEYCSPSIPLTGILDKYHSNAGERLWDAKHEYLSNEVERIKKENDRMQIELRHLKGEDILNMHSHKELISIEEALENGLANVRDRKMEIFENHKKNERMLEEENKRLRSTYIVRQQQMAMDSNVREMENEYHEKVRGYPPQMPFTFRVLPIQPNLQERK